MEYKDVLNQIEEILARTKFAVLATANKEGIVSASQMSIVNDGLKIYFQTDSTFEKVKNIKENPNVAINIGAYYFKGIAKIAGHPTENKLFINELKEKHLKAYNSYTKLPNEVLIEIKLTEARIWGIDKQKDVDTQETIQVVDLVNKKINTTICDKM